MKYGRKWPEYAKQWDAMVIKPARRHEFESIAHHLIALKDRYVPIEKATGVPWYMIALIHMREASNDFSKGLAQGDRWDRRSHNKPICGPFKSFFDSAVWALKHDGLTNVLDWRLEKQLYFHELFNGAGYDMRHLPSPYIFGGTNQQRAGKFIRDGVFSSTTWDIQPGVAPIMKVMMEFDPTIKPARED
jgi:lysozyme family protein